MTIRAYRKTKIQYAESTFSIREDDVLFDFLDGEVDIYSEIHGGVGLVNVPVAVLQKAVRKSVTLGLDDQTVKNLKDDILFAKKHNDEAVMYHCF